MTKKQKTSKITYEKPLAIAGVMLTVLSVMASSYNLSVNLRFIHDPIGLIYYLNYLILLGGGFAAGYLLTRTSSRTSRLFSGSAYALLAMVLYTLTFAVQFVIERIFGALPFPWGRILFEGAPLFALVITTVVAYLLQFRRGHKSLSPASMWTFITTYIIAELYNIGNILYWQFMTPADPSYQAPWWLVIGSFILNPLVITVVAYLSFGQIKTVASRLFAAAFVGIFSETLAYALWNFRTDPSSSATEIFQAFVFVITLFVTALLILKVHKTAR